MLSGATYAYFTATVTNGDKGSSVIIQTGSLRLVYSDTEFINVSGILPGDSYSKTVTVTNEGNVDVYYDLVWIELLNELTTKSDLVMSMTCASSTDTCDGYSETTVANSGSNIPILYNEEIGALEVHTYVITILFKETGSNQNDNQGKNITGKIGIIESGTYTTELYGYVYDESSNAMSNVIVELHSDPVSVLTDANGRYELPNITLGNHTAYVKTSDGASTIMTTTMSIKYGSLKTVDGTNATVMKSDSATIGINIYKTGSTPALALVLPSATHKDLGWNGGYRVYKSSITSITFDNVINVPGDAISSWDVSKDSNSTIVAYIKSDGISGYQLHIQAKDEMYAPTNSENLFADFTKVTSISGLQYFDTKNTTNISYMFQNCSSLTSLNLSTFDVSNVTSDFSEYLFRGCSSLEYLNISNWNLVGVTGLDYLFYQLSNLETIELNNINTSNINDMYYMFRGCSSLTALDLSSFDTSNVTTISYMFGDCSSLTTLDLSGFNTDKLNNAVQSFMNCSSLTSINFSNWIFNSSIKPSTMIYNTNTTSLTTIILKNVNISKLTSLSNMFLGCTALTTLNLSSFDTSNITNMEHMFNGCSSLTTLDLSTFDTSKVWNIDGMFSNCSSLTTLYLSNAVFNQGISYQFVFGETVSSHIFMGITSGISIYVKDASAQTFINDRLADLDKTGTVTIA